MRKKKTTPEVVIITYEDYILDEWLSEMIDELISSHPNFYEEISTKDEWERREPWALI